MFIKMNLAAIPGVVVSIILWILIGGIYMSLVPENFAGKDNMGIGLSVLGLCLFIADRLAYLFFNAHSWLIIMKTWLWGLGFMIAGLAIWIGDLSSKNLLVFMIHWLVSLAIIGFLTWFSMEHVESKPILRPEAAGNESETEGDSKAKSSAQ